MLKIMKLPIVAGLILALWQPIYGQEFEDFVSAYTGDNGTMYLQPLGDALGANLNSNLFHSAIIPRMGFTLEIGIATSTVFVANKDKTFLATPDPSFSPANPADVPVTAPTVFGDTRSVTLEGVEGTATSFPGGIALDAVPVAIPQLRIGAVLGTDVTLRYFAIDIGEELGSLDLFGFGIRHSVSQYLPDVFPVDLAVGYYNQSLNLENFSETSTSLFNVQGSFKKGPLIVYSALGYESADTNFSYTSTEDDSEINIDLQTSSSIRFTLGATLKLGAFFLNTDYNLGINNVLAVGIGLSFGEK